MKYYLGTSHNGIYGIFDAQENVLYYVTPEHIKDLLDSNEKPQVCPEDTKIELYNNDFPGVEIWPIDRRKEYAATHILESELDFMIPKQGHLCRYSYSYLRAISKSQPDFVFE